MLRLLLLAGAVYVPDEDRELEPLYPLLRVVVLGRVRTVASDCTRLEDELLVDRKLLLLAASPLVEEVEDDRMDERFELLLLEVRLLSLLKEDERVDEFRFEVYLLLALPALYLLEEFLPDV